MQVFQHLLKELLLKSSVPLKQLCDVVEGRLLLCRPARMPLPKKKLIRSAFQFHFCRAPECCAKNPILSVLSAAPQGWAAGRAFT